MFHGEDAYREIHEEFWKEAVKLVTEGAKFWLNILTELKNRGVKGS